MNTQRATIRIDTINNCTIGYTIVPIITSNCT